MIPELRAVLEAQRARVETIQRKTGRVVPWIFCRVDGAPVGDFKRAWATACIRAGFFRVAGTDAKGHPIKRRHVPLLVSRADALRSQGEDVQVVPQNFLRATH